jgi:adenosylhomocysteine nucleosidase
MTLRMPGPLRIGIIAALPGELKPLVRDWPRTDQVFCGQIGAAECYAACEGMGAAAATRSFAALRTAAGELDILVSYGWAGALTCAVKPAQVYAISQVVDARTGERFTAEVPATVPMTSYRLVSLDHVALKPEKRTLAERYGAVLVDMEAATVGRLARAHGAGFLCLRGVSDGDSDDLPDFNRFITPAGQLRTTAFALHALLRPGSLGLLLELGRNSRAAAEALAHELQATLARLKLVS